MYSSKNFMSLDEIIRQNEEKYNAVEPDPDILLMYDDDDLMDGNYEPEVIEEPKPNRSVSSTVRVVDNVDSAVKPTFQAASSKNINGTKLFISNICFKLVEADLWDAFEELGNVVSVLVLRDNKGRSLGKAEIIFRHRFDAQRAMREYNGMTLNNREMRITLGAPKTPPDIPKLPKVSRVEKPQSTVLSINHCNNCNSLVKHEVFHRRNTNVVNNKIREPQNRKRAGPVYKENYKSKRPTLRPSADELDRDIEDYWKSATVTSEMLDREIDLYMLEANL